MAQQLRVLLLHQRIWAQLLESIRQLAHSHLELQFQGIQCSLLAAMGTRQTLKYIF